MSRTITRSRQSTEHIRGRPEPLDPDDCYQVSPGEAEGGPEYFPVPGQGMLDGLAAAITRAVWLSIGHPPQRVTRIRPDGQARVIRRYRNGRSLAAVSGNDYNHGRTRS
jgi:hypothetical protein